MLGERINRDAYIYALAAYEYYWGEQLGTIILSDAEYDALTTILKAEYHRVPLELQNIFCGASMLGQGMTHVRLSGAVLKRAQRAYRHYLLDKAGKL